MLTCILLYADMYFFIVMHVPNYNNTCQNTGECMSTCIQKFNMYVNKKYMSTYRRMHVNMNSKSNMHVKENRM
jgi:hypothetical protein